MAATSFGCGMLPLAFALSRSYIERLSAVGTGLLLGAALGVIVPEGIETTVESTTRDADFPTKQIALALLAGFTFMLLVEQLGTGGHAHGTPQPQIEFDAELDDLEPGRAVPKPEDFAPERELALPMTLGLVVHGLADGLALGVSSLTPAHTEGTNALSLVVFLALILHKAPTSLALTTSLLASNVPRPTCKKHLAIFASATPLSALVCYAIFSLFGLGHSTSWTGLALLFSGGTFLYVATVLQPVSSQSVAQELSRRSRVFLIVIGLFIPFVLSSVLGHGH